MQHNIEEIELSDAVHETTAVRNLNDLKEASKTGQKVLLNEHYDVLRSFTMGNTVILDTIWTGTLAIPIGTIPVGGEMKAYFTRLYDFTGNDIIKPRNYDCLEPIY